MAGESNRERQGSPNNQPDRRHVGKVETDRVREKQAQDAAGLVEAEVRRHREFLLAALRAASLRAKVMEADITTIGLALREEMIDNETAVRWIMEAGLMGMVGAIPERVGKVAMTHGPEKLEATNG